MKKRYAISLVLIALLLVCSVLIGTSYSLWNVAKTQSGINQLNVGCFNISFDDEGFTGAGDINLDNSYPISDNRGNKTTSYKFTIENTCSNAANYQVALETLNTSTFDTNYLRVLFNDADDSVIYSTLDDATPQLTEATASKELVSGYLQPTGKTGSSVEYSLRVWVDYNATESTENVMGKVWNGKVSVYSEATPKIQNNVEFAQYLKGLTDSETVIQNDGTTDQNMRYIGASPNNYVTFNGEEAGWRVIGVFGSNSHGQDSQLVKLVRTSSIGEYQWDSSNSGGIHNIWGGSELEKVLNDGYFNATASYNYFDSEERVVDFSSIGLTSTAKNMIKNVTWKLGAFDWSDPNTFTPTLVYDAERSDTVSETTDYEVTWNDTGNIALPYLSDFALATSGNSTVLRSTCLSSDINSNSNDWISGTGECAINSWLYKYVNDNSKNSWTLTSSVHDDSIYVVNDDITSSSSQNNITTSIASTAYNALPTIYLKSNVMCTNCDDLEVGTQANPFKLTLS